MFTVHPPTVPVIILNTYRTALDLLCHEDFNVGRSKAGLGQHGILFKLMLFEVLKVIPVSLICVKMWQNEILQYSIGLLDRARLADSTHCYPQLHYNKLDPR